MSYLFVFPAIFIQIFSFLIMKEMTIKYVGLKIKFDLCFFQLIANCTGNYTFYSTKSLNQITRFYFGL